MLYSFNFWHQYEFLLYNLQQNILSVLFIKINTLSPLVIFLLLFTGILTSITPCFLSIIPLSISYININKKNYIYKNIFILGILTSLFLVICITAFINYNYITYIARIPFLSFFILILISLNLLQILNFSFNLKIFNFNKFNFFNRNILLNTYFSGFIIGLSSVPCSSPIVLLINFWLHYSNNILFFLLYLMFYSLGCFIPFIIIFNFLINYLEFYILGYIWNLIIPFAGSIILSFSIFFFLEKIFI
uniref:Uncharacterized protein n=1 Tax=Dasya binghamiae TaxID=1896963 RepID=A0A1C8XRU5_9FLOR|nr:hypothetical protein BI108_pgp006 [Dasya binghamiae]AOH77209.1 hypothetical protein [Dasya binghamiae]